MNIKDDRQTTITSRINQDIKDAFKQECINQKVGMSDKLNQLIEDWLRINQSLPTSSG
jgi:hypothetical protein